MAEGVRIQHPTESSVMFTLVDGARPLGRVTGCGTCHRPHAFKTYHLVLDDAGSVIVSTTIWDRLRGIPGQPFHLANAVARPPDQHVVVTTPLIARMRGTTPGGIDGPRSR
jgi:hypothetical protein